jgi:hypothetical protein
MKVLKFLLVILSFSVFADEENIAIKAANYSIGTNISYTDSRYGESDRVSIGGKVRLPIYKIIGIDSGVSAGHSRTKFDSTGNKCSINGKLGYVDVIIREPKMGQLSLGYSKSDSISCSDSGETVKNGTFSSYSVSGSYYLNDFSIGASANGKLLNDLSSYSVGLGYYINQNSSVGFNFSTVPNRDYRDYSISYSIQPRLLKDDIRLYARYARSLQESEFQNINSNTISVGFNYFFGNKIDMKTRDRFY